MPTDFMHAPPIGGQPECDHPPEKRSVTTFFHQRPPSRLHVTTFPQSADTDGEAVTTSRLLLSGEAGIGKSRILASGNAFDCGLDFDDGGRREEKRVLRSLTS
jgi:hypothetical protein